MPRKKILSIPLELQQTKAYELYQQHLLEGRESSPQDNWSDAEKYFVMYPNKVLIWKLKRIRKLAKSSLNTCWRILVFPSWLLWKLPKLFSQSETKAFALDIVKTFITALGLIATFVAGIGLLINYWSSLENIKLTQKNIELTQEKLLTDRLSKSIELIGSSKEEVILGGLYSLERIMEDSPRDRSKIIEILTSFIRKNSRVYLKENNNKLRQKLSSDNHVSMTIQSATKIIGRRKYDNNTYKDRLNLNGANLNGSDLDEADLSGAKLIKASLNEANLSGAKLNESDLHKASLNGASLNGSNLNRANLNEASLNGATLIEAQLAKASLNGATMIGTDMALVNLIKASLLITNLSNANLSNANLSNANLWKANLGNANLGGSNLSGANLSQANLSKANLNGANLRGSNLREATLNGADLGEGRSDLHGANLRKANLREVRYLTHKQIKTACYWDEAKYVPGKLDEIKQDRTSDPKEPIDCSRWKPWE
jgi:uncharacterized protein YjbI with pentapeptide repeats